jgi:hypothetical protein
MRERSKTETIISWSIRATTLPVFPGTFEDQPREDRQQSKQH